MSVLLPNIGAQPSATLSVGVVSGVIVPIDADDRSDAYGVSFWCDSNFAVYSFARIFLKHTVALAAGAWILFGLFPAPLRGSLAPVRPEVGFRYGQTRAFFYARCVFNEFLENSIITIAFFDC